MAEHVVFSTEANVGIVTLNDTARGNVLTRESMGQLFRALKAVVRDRAVKVIVIRSAGGTFCLGMDLGSAGAARFGRAAKSSIRLYVKILKIIFSSPKPVMCLVTGEVKAGGVGLVSACDIVIATPKAAFQLSEVFWGLIPANVIPFICAVRLPPQKVKYLILTGKEIGAEEAKVLQLVDEVFPEVSFEKEVGQIIKNLFRANRIAMADAKQCINAFFAKKLDSMTKRTRQRFVKRMRDPEVVAAMLGLREGSAPSWWEPYAPADSVTKGPTP
jgi:enoyl-CoA hydratase/carnithine racemase